MERGNRERQICVEGGKTERWRGVEKIEINERRRTERMRADGKKDRYKRRRTAICRENGD